MWQDELYKTLNLNTSDVHSYNLEDIWNTFFEIIVQICSSIVSFASK